MLWIANQTAGTQISQRISVVHHRESCDPAAAHRDYDIAARPDVSQVSAQLVMQLAHADLSLQLLAM